jgi:nitrite reductase/ring-hydroxylating ferredoxin subunit
VLDGCVPVIRASEVAPGAMTWAVIDRQRIVIANVDGAFYALHDVCGHRGAPLSRGTLTGHVIECPLHFACFDVRTGKLLSGPTSADVPACEVRVEDDVVYVSRAPRR